MQSNNTLCIFFIESENALFGLDKNIHKFNVSRRREREKKR